MSKSVMNTYPTYYDHLRAHLSRRFPWLDLDFRTKRVDTDDPSIVWLYPVVMTIDDFARLEEEDR